MRNVTWIFF